MKPKKIIIILLLILFLTSCSSSRSVNNRVDKVIETMDALDCYRLDYIFFYRNEYTNASNQITITYDQVNRIRYFEFAGYPDSRYYIHEIESYLEVYRLHDGVWLIEAIPLNDSNDHENEFLDFIFSSMKKDGRVSFSKIYFGSVSILVDILYSDMLPTMEIEWFELDEDFGNLDMMEDEYAAIDSIYTNGEPTYINMMSISVKEPSFSDASEYFIILSIDIYNVPLLELPTII